MKDISSAAPPASSYLSYAAWRGNMLAVREWLQKGLKIEEVAGGRTPVLWAISGGDKNMTDLLISKGADISKKTADGDTALICAVWGGNIEIVRMLLDKGFNESERGSQGKTALNWAEECGRPAVRTLLAEAAHARIASRQQQLKEQARHKLKPRFSP